MINEFKKIGSLLFQERLVDSHGGSMSRREGDKIFITVRDAMLADLDEDDIIEVGLEPGDKEELAPLELVVHREIYKKTDKTAIVYARPANGMAVSITDNKIVPQDSNGLSLFKAASIVRVRDGVGSSEAARLVPSFLTNDNVIAMVKGAGSFAISSSLEEAYRYTSALELSCRILVAVRSSGGRPEGGKPAGRRESGGRPLGMRGGHRDKGGYKSAIPPGIGVMDRSRNRNR